MKLRLLIPAIGITIGSLANAAIIASDGFDIDPGALAGSGSGSGWVASSTWSEPAASFQVTTGSLVYGSLDTSGNKIVSQTNGTNIAARGLSAAAPSSGEFWVSFMIDSQGFDAGGITFDKAVSTANLNLLSTGWNDRARFGVGINAGNFVYTLDGRGTPVFGSVTGATGDPTFIVAKFDVTNGKFSMWANPTIGGANPSGGTTVATDVSFVRSGATFAGDVQTVGAYANWGGVALDEVRLGTSFSDVSPVPEPATTAAWLGMVCIGAMILRRRRAS